MSSSCLVLAITILSGVNNGVKIIFVKGLLRQKDF